jgi:hypothetical protein
MQTTRGEKKQGQTIFKMAENRCQKTRVGMVKNTGQHVNTLTRERERDPASPFEVEWVERMPNMWHLGR